MGRAHNPYVLLPVYPSHKDSTQGSQLQAGGQAEHPRQVGRPPNPHALLPAYPHALLPAYTSHTGALRSQLQAGGQAEHPLGALHRILRHVLRLLVAQEVTVCGMGRL